MAESMRECLAQCGVLYCSGLVWRDHRETNMMLQEVTVVRIYLTEGETQLNSLLKRLRDFEKVRGVTVFRGISGFGDSGVIHGSKWIDVSLDLPMVIEFFDTPDKIKTIIEHLNTFIKPGHMMMWTANINHDQE